MAIPTDVRYSLKGRKVWVAGHRGMVGAALIRRLAREDCKILTVPHREVDLRRQAEVEAWMDKARPDTVFMAAATVGGIYANDTRPAEFIYDNLLIEANIINTARAIGVDKLLFLGSSCIYPKLAAQPMAEDALLTGPLEPTNQWYAIAKIAGIKLCQAYRRQYGCDFISAMPTNLYGPGDNFDPLYSHVVPALMRRVHEAKIGGTPVMEIWGTGTPRREFLYVDDLADALVHLVKHYTGDDHVNVGTGTDVTIAELASQLAEIVGFNGDYHYLTDKPDGTPRKLLDCTRLHDMGWSAPTPLREGLQRAYAWFRDNVAG